MSSSIREYIEKSRLKLEQTLGQGKYQVISWRYNSFYKPDLVEIKRVSDGKIISWSIEINSLECEYIRNIHKQEILKAFGE